MKLTLALLLGSFLSFGNTSSKWVPKYQKTNKKSLDSKILKSQVGKNKSKTKSIAASEKKIVPLNKLEALYLKETKKKNHLSLLKKETLAIKQEAVPTLLKVMKSNKFPSESRWVATYMLGRIMGVKSAPLISKYASHPNWMLRLASLKVLLHLGQTKYAGIYARLLDDKSLIVRHQALQNIKKLKLTKLGPYVWKMLYNKENYIGLSGKRKRSNIIKDVIKTVGDLGFTQAKKPMLKMFLKTKYKDVYAELDYSLSKLSKKASPKGSLSVKKHFWKNAAIKEITI